MSSRARNRRRSVRTFADTARRYNDLEDLDEDDRAGDDARDELLDQVTALLRDASEEQLQAVLDLLENGDQEPDEDFDEAGNPGPRRADFDDEESRSGGYGGLLRGRADSYAESVPDGNGMFRSRRGAIQYFSEADQKVRKGIALVYGSREKWLGTVAPSPRKRRPRRFGEKGYLIDPPPAAGQAPQGGPDARGGKAGGMKPGGVVEGPDEDGMFSDSTKARRFWARHSEDMKKMGYDTAEKYAEAAVRKR
jgi:hypothetical protein